MNKRILFFFICISTFFTVHGRSLPALRINESKNYLETDQGVPFLWIGDTAWELLHRLDRADTDFYLEDRSAKGFNIIQTVILAELDGLRSPNANGDLPLHKLDPTQLNEAYFKHVDYVVKKAEKEGLYLALLPTWGDKFNKKWGTGPEIFTPENAAIFGRLLAERYAGQTNIIWILGGDRPIENKLHSDIIKAMARGLKKGNNEALVSYHPSGAKAATDFINEAWLDFDMFQSGHDRRARDYDFVRRCKERTPKRPVINGEPRYENIPDRFWEEGKHEWIDDSDARVAAYHTMLAGGAGYTYGCNDIWQMYSIEHTPVINARTGWRMAMQLPGSSQMQHMKKLLTAFGWPAIQPAQEVILNDNPDFDHHVIAASGNNKQFLLIYTPMGQAIEADLSYLDDSLAKAYWYNPRSGESMMIGVFKTEMKHTFTPWASGRGSDFLLILTTNTMEYPLNKEKK